MDLGEAELKAAELKARERQYGAYVDHTERLVDRRAEANRFYVALDLAIVGAIGVLFSDRLNVEVGLVPVEWIVAIFAFAGLVVSYNWRCVIASQRKLLRAKFEVIHELEKALPTKPYADEWARSAPGRAKVSIARFEGRLPWLFMTFFVIVLALTIAGALDVDLGGLVRDLASQVG